MLESALIGSMYLAPAIGDFVRFVPNSMVAWMNERAVNVSLRRIKENLGALEKYRMRQARLV